MTLGSSFPPSSSLQRDEHIADFLQVICSAKDRPGAFAEFLIVDQDLVSVKQAASVSLVTLMAVQAVRYRLGPPAPLAYGRQGGLAEN